jgi:hypothetical protein
VRALAKGVEGDRDERNDEVRPEHQSGVVASVVVVDRRLVEMAVAVAEVRDRDCQHGGEQEAVAEPGAEDAQHSDCQVGETHLGLEAAVAVGEADVLGRVGAVEEVEHRAEDRRDADRDDHPPDEEDLEGAGAAARLSVAVDMDRGADQ